MFHLKYICLETCPSIVTSSDQSVMPPVCEDQVLEGTACTFMCDNNFLLEGSEVRFLYLI